MDIEDFKDSFKYYTIAYLRQGWKTSFLEKRASVNQRLYKFNFTITEKDYDRVNNCAAPASKSNLMVSERFSQALDEEELVMLDSFDEDLYDEEFL